MFLVCRLFYERMMGRVYQPKPCKFCGLMIKYNNLYRHMAHIHGRVPKKRKGKVVTLPETGQAQSSAEVPSGNHSFDHPLQHEEYDEDEADDVPIDIIKDCVINMFRQANLRNIPALSEYLEEYYSEIPACLRIPIIVSAYTAAQKVAFTHDDIKDGQDVERARQSMARWRHGLSAIAPTKERDYWSTASSRSSSASSFRRGQVSNQPIASSTPLSQSSSMFNAKSLQPEMMERSSVVPASSGGNMKPPPPNEPPSGMEREHTESQLLVLVQPLTGAVEMEQVTLPPGRGSEDDPFTVDSNVPTDVAGMPAGVSIVGEQPAGEDILARAMQEICTPSDKKERKYKVGVLKKRKLY